MVHNNLVRVACITFNHERYILDTINGFSMQVTNFPFVCTIIDDASTDGEQDVIKTYLDKHFNMSRAKTWETDEACYIEVTHNENLNCSFVVIFLKYNFYSLKKPKTSLISDWNDTKYIAFCEGDDYWTDPYKLQRQIDFLESHPEYTMCFHDVDIKVEDGREKYDVFGILENRDYTGLENMMKWSVPTCSMVYRNEMLDLLPRNGKFCMGDNVMVLTCSKYGKIRCIAEKMGVYRLTPTSWIGGQSDKTQRYKYISHYTGLIEEFEECRCEPIYKSLEGQYFQLLTILKREGNQEEFERVKNEYLHYPGMVHWKRFKTYYRKSQLRNCIKRFLGANAVSLYRKIRYSKK